MKSSYTREFNFTKYLEKVCDAETILYTGRVSGVKGLEIESEGPRSVIGEICTIKLPDGKAIKAEVVGLDGIKVRLTAFGETKGIEVGCEVIASGATLQVPVGMSLLGRTIDATGEAIDGLGEISPETYYPAIEVSPDPMRKAPVNKRITTGVRAIDSLLTIGKGQRIGIFAGSGVGKSTLLSALEAGVYDHIAGDGREYVITDSTAMKIRSEDVQTQLDLTAERPVVEGRIILTIQIWEVFLIGICAGAKALRWLLKKKRMERADLKAEKERSTQDGELEYRESDGHHDAEDP